MNSSKDSGAYKYHIYLIKVPTSYFANEPAIRASALIQKWVFDFSRNLSPAVLYCVKDNNSFQTNSYIGETIPSYASDDLIDKGIASN